MAEKKEPIRTCIVCRTKLPQKELLRLSLNKQGSIDLDLNVKKSGRGAYVCKGCMDKCIKTKALNRAFKRKISEEIYEELKKKL